MNRESEGRRPSTTAFFHGVSAQPSSALERLSTALRNAGHEGLELAASSMLRGRFLITRHQAGCYQWSCAKSD